MDTDDNFLEVSRTISTTRDKVFAAWSRAEQFAQWWGPQGVFLPSCQIDFKVGGQWRCQMKSPNGWEMWLAGEFIEIVPNELIVKTEYPIDAAGHKISLKEMAGEDWPDETQVHVTLTEEAGTTKVTLRQGPIPPSPGRAQAERGCAEALACLEEFLQEDNA